MLMFLALARFTILLFVLVLLASVLPVSGQAAEVFGWVTTGAIAILSFLHGAKLSRGAVVQGFMHWKLHTLVFALTFALFPILGLLAKPILLQCSDRSCIGVSCLCVSCHPLCNPRSPLLQWLMAMSPGRYVVPLFPI